MNDSVPPEDEFNSEEENHFEKWNKLWQPKKGKREIVMKNLISEENLKGVRFTYIRGDIGKKVNIPLGCIAYRSNLEKGEFQFEISAHNPKDDFDRLLARQVACGRMMKHPRIIPFNKETPPVLPELLKMAVQDLLNNPILQRPIPRGKKNSSPEILPERLRQAFVQYMNRQKKLMQVVENKPALE